MSTVPLTGVMMTCSERWRPIVGYESHYEVSSLGRVRSIDRIISFSDSKPDREIKGRFLTPQKDKYGYERVRICIGGVKSTFKVHRVVAQAFIPNPEGKPQVNHINGVKHDNRLENLEWATNKENQIHAVSHGLRRHEAGKLSNAFRGTVQVFKDGWLEFEVNGNKDMIRRGLDPRLVSRCLSGKSKTHKGYTFRRIIEEK